jgi:hypothetical protein
VWSAMPVAVEGRDADVLGKIQVSGTVFCFAIEHMVHQPSIGGSPRSSHPAQPSLSPLARLKVGS